MARNRQAYESVYEAIDVASFVIAELIEMGERSRPDRFEAALVDGIDGGDIEAIVTVAREAEDYWATLPIR